MEILKYPVQIMTNIKRLGLETTRRFGMGVLVECWVFLKRQNVSRAKILQFMSYL